MNEPLPTRAPAAAEASAPPGRDLLAALFVFLIALTVFWRSPIEQVADSHYTLLLSLNIVEGRGFALDRYFHEPLDTSKYPIGYSVKVTRGHHYYEYPPGSSVLSVPFVAVARRFGLSPAGPDGLYDRNAEVKLQRALAALLMAGLAAFAYLTARQLLPAGWSLLVAALTAFGTPVWSTASRSLWSHTWCIFLLSIVLWLVLRAEARGGKFHPLLAATLLSWMYFTRPAASLSIIAVAVWVLLRRRRDFIPFTVTGALWFGLFLAYSHRHFGTWLPIYYIHGSGVLSFGPGYPTALAGVLFSPSRGMLTYVPGLLVVLALLAVFRAALPHRLLVALALGAGAANVITTAAFPNWYGGGSYGPRYATDMVPWWTLAAILAIAAWRATPAANPARRRARWLAFAAPLLALGVFIHFRGATSIETWYTWNSLPVPIDNDLPRLWQWERPQFLEGLTATSRRISGRDPDAPPAAPVAPGASEPAQAAPPLPEGRPARIEAAPILPVGTRVDLRAADSDRYLLGFSAATPEGRRFAQAADFGFVLDRYDRIVILRIKVRPVLDPKHGVASRKLTLQFNGRPLAAWILRDTTARVLTVPLPRNAWASHNVLGFDILAARPPASPGQPGGGEPHGAVIEWLEIAPEPASSAGGAA